MVGGRISTGRHHCRFDEKRRKIGHQPAAFACRKTEKARRFERDQELTLIPLRAKLGIGHFGVPRRDAVRRNRFAAFRGAVRGHPDPQAPAMRRPGRPQFDTSTARRVEHPCCDRRHNAGHDLDVDKLALLTVLAVVQPQTTTEIGMPATMDDNFSPARDRMFGRWLCHENPRNNISELAIWSMISLVISSQATRPQESVGGSSAPRPALRQMADPTSAIMPAIPRYKRFLHRWWKPRARSDERCSVAEEQPLYS